jgi:hypothetical protein
MRGRKKRKRQTYAALKRAIRTGEKQDLNKYLKMRQEDNEQASGIDHLRVMGPL